MPHGACCPHTKCPIPRFKACAPTAFTPCTNAHTQGSGREKKIERDNLTVHRNRWLHGSGSSGPPVAQGLRAGGAARKSCTPAFAHQGLGHSRGLPCWWSAGGEAKADGQKDTPQTPRHQFSCPNGEQSVPRPRVDADPSWQMSTWCAHSAGFRPEFMCASHQLEHLVLTPLRLLTHQKIPTRHGCTFTMERQKMIQGGKERDSRHKHMHTHTHTHARPRARTHTHAHINSNRGFANDFVGHQCPHAKHPAGNYHVVFVACACAPDLNEPYQCRKGRLSCWHRCAQETLLSEIAQCDYCLAVTQPSPLRVYVPHSLHRGAKTMTSPN